MKTKKSSRLLCCFAVLIFVVVSTGQAQNDSDSLFSVSSMRSVQFDSLLETGYVVTLNPNAISKIYDNVPSTTTLNIPLSTNYIATIDLKYSPLWMGAFAVRNEEGILQNLPTSVCYRGTIRGAARSMVAITFCENQIIGVLSDETGNYVIGRYTGSDAEEGDYLIYNDKNLSQLLRQFSCGKIDNDSVNNESKPNKSSKAKGNNMLTSSCPIVSIYVECEYEMYQSFSSSIARTAEYVIGMFNVVGAIYENEGIGIRIDNLIIWTSADPYTESYDPYNPYAMLQNSLDEYKDYRDPYSGNLAFLFRKAPSGYVAGGIADEVGDDLCDDDDAYAMAWMAGNNIFAEGLYSRDAKVCAHEIGHLLNSPHTHWCGWSGGPIDNCSAPEPSGDCSPGPTPATGGGTIMSYCDHSGGVGINFANGFGTQPGNRIREWVDDYSYCMSGISTSACFQNSTWTDTYYLEYDRETIKATNSECSPGGTHGPVSIENTSGVIFWLAGESISLKPGFHKKNLGGTFNARVVPWLDCNTSTATKGNNHAKSIFTGENTDDNEHEVTIIPNPATDEIQILGTITAPVELFSSVGLSMMTVEKGVRKVDVSQLTSGVYYARVPTVTGVVVKSFMIIR